jgi:hypothetical protein
VVIRAPEPLPGVTDHLVAHVADGGAIRRIRGVALVEHPLRPGIRRSTPLFSEPDAADVLDQIQGAIAYVDTPAPQDLREPTPSLRQHPTHIYSSSETRPTHGHVPARRQNRGAYVDIDQPHGTSREATGACARSWAIPEATASPTVERASLSRITSHEGMSPARARMSGARSHAT